MRARTYIAIALLLIWGLAVLTACRSVFPPPFTATTKISLQSADPGHEGRYVFAQDKNEDWLLTQRTGRDDCAWFTLLDLGKDEEDNRIVALKTCHNRFVTVPRGDTERPDKRQETRRDRMAWQELRPGDCARFTLEQQSDGTVAFRTCGHRYLTAGDDGVGWASPLEWAIVVENPMVEAWEKFNMLPQP